MQLDVVRRQEEEKSAVENIADAVNTGLDQRGK